jgi:hypothetical protein
MEAEITAEGLRIGGDLIPPSPHALDAVLGTSYREIQIPLHGGEVRRIRVFDDLGFVYYLDETPPEVSSVLFALFPEDAPFSIRHPFSGCLRVNNASLTAEMTAARLPTSGTLVFEPQFGHKWRAATPNFSVWLSLRRRPNRVGRRTGAQKLVDVSICYTPKTANKTLQATAAVPCGSEPHQRHNAVVAGASALPAAVPELGR